MAITPGLKFTPPPGSKPRDIALDSDDLRDLGFYIRYLETTYTHRPFTQSFVEESKRSIKDALKKYLDVHFQDTAQRESINSTLVNEAKGNILPSFRFEWLNKDEAACSFIWGYIANTSNSIFPKHPGFVSLDQNPYEWMGLPKTTTSHKERFKLVTDYFDNLVLTQNTVPRKVDLLEQLKTAWQLAIKAVKRFNWLEENDEDSCDWAWKYLEKYDQEEKATTRSGIVSLPYFFTSTTAEKHLAIYSALRLWNCHPSEITLLIKNMNKAWHQRRLRRERLDKKAINCYVDVKVKEKLDQLARYNHCQINIALTELINNEYMLLEDEIKKRFNT